MRHFFAPGPVTAGTLGMSEAPLAGLLVAPACLAYTRTAYLLRAAIAVALAAITAAANDDLGPAMGAQEQTASGLHRRSLQDADSTRHSAPTVKYWLGLRLTCRVWGRGTGSDSRGQ